MTGLATQLETKTLLLQCGKSRSAETRLAKSSELIPRRGKRASHVTACYFVVGIYREMRMRTSLQRGILTIYCFFQHMKLLIIEVPIVWFFMWRLRANALPSRHLISSMTQCLIL